jgi:hypothetical protein
VSEGCQNVIQRGPSSAVRHGPGQYERQVSKIGRGFFELGEAMHSDNGGNRAMMTGYHDVSAVLGISYQAGNATLRRVGDAELMSID